jgi:hypothetical protein
MKQISNDLADRYRGATRDERAAEKASAAVIRAVNKVAEAATAEGVSPEMARRLLEVRTALLPVSTEAGQLHTGAVNRAQQLAHLAVMQADDDSGDDWGEQTERHDTDRAPTFDEASP